VEVVLVPAIDVVEVSNVVAEELLVPAEKVELIGPTLMLE
jgi:hypothetical protein